MEHTQTRALTALEPYLHLARTIRLPAPRMVADLIERVTSAPYTFIFGELLLTPAVQSLQSAETPPEFKSLFTLLEIFCYGTIKDYESTPNLPPLSPPQKHKLNLLTLLSLASEPHTLTFSFLLTHLSLSDHWALQSLLSEAISLDLISARLSPATHPPLVHITSIASIRDPHPSTFPEIQHILSVWQNRCSSVVGDIEAQIAGVRAAAKRRAIKESARQDVVEAAVADLDSTKQVFAVGGGLLARAKDGKGTSGGVGRGKGLGTKRGLEASQEDDDEEIGSGDGGVGATLAQMEVDEGAGASKGPEGRRNAKRPAGKKTA